MYNILKISNFHRFIKFRIELLELLYLHEIYSMNTLLFHINEYLSRSEFHKVEKMLKSIHQLNWTILKISNFHRFIKFRIELLELLYLHEIYSMNALFSHMSGYLSRSELHKVDKINKSASKILIDFIG